MRNHPDSPTKSELTSEGVEPQREGEIPTLISELLEKLNATERVVSELIGATGPIANWEAQDSESDPTLERHASTEMGAALLNAINSVDTIQTAMEDHIQRLEL